MRLLSRVSCLTNPVLNKELFFLSIPVSSRQRNRMCSSLVFSPSPLDVSFIKTDKVLDLCSPLWRTAWKVISSLARGWSFPSHNNRTLWFEYEVDQTQRWAFWSVWIILHRLRNRILEVHLKNLFFLQGSTPQHIKRIPIVAELEEDWNLKG